MRKIALAAVILLTFYSCKKDATQPKNNDNLIIEIDCPGQCVISIDTAATYKSTYSILERDKTVMSYKKSYHANSDFGMNVSIMPVIVAPTSVKVTLDGKVIIDQKRNGLSGWGFSRGPVTN